MIHNSDGITRLLEASIFINAAKKEASVKDNQIRVLVGFLSKALETYECVFDTDESAWSDQDLEDYIEMATFMAKHHGRTNNRIKNFEERLNRLPY